MEINDKIHVFIANNLIGLAKKMGFSDNADIFELGFVSSLFAMQLIHFVQEEFDITLDDEDITIANLSSVNRIVRLIRAKQE